MAGVAGTNITVNCGYKDIPSLTIGWVEYINDPLGHFIFVGDIASDPVNEEVYSLSNGEDGNYNLQINLLTSNGGKYGCMLMTPIHETYTATVNVFSEFMPPCEMYSASLLQSKYSVS